MRNDWSVTWTDRRGTKGLSLWRENFWQLEGDGMGNSSIHLYQYSEYLLFGRDRFGLYLTAKNREDIRFPE